MAIFNKDSKGIDDIKNLPANSNALSIIAAGTKILGDIDTDGVVKIEGRVEGGRINGSVRIADAKEPGSDEQIHPSPVAVLR